MEEKPLYQRGKVTITPSKFTVSNKSYTVKSISSATVRTLPANKMPLFLLLVAGVLIMMVKDMLLIGSAIVAAFVIFYIFMKDEYAVRISNANGYIDSFTSTKREVAEEVAVALNDAMSISVYANRADLSIVEPV